VTRVFFDSSVLIPALAAAHPRHEASLSWVRRVAGGEITGILAAHTAAECYRAFSSLPLSPRPSAAGLRALGEHLLGGTFTVVEARAQDYRRVIETCAEGDLRGAIVYDVLLLDSARRSRADWILTHDLRDFRRIAPDLAGRIRTP
jgi:predicted nucleic acid-binding protein